MGLARLPRDLEEQKRWARRLLAELSIPPVDLFRAQGQTFAQSYPTVFRRAYELGAEAALREVLAELDRSDDPLAGLPPHLVKSAKAAARARRRRMAA
jgi:hypothetical protein